MRTENAIQNSTAAVGPLDGRVALVTGGGRGLGEAICRVLAAAGASVVAGDVRVGAAQGVVEDIVKTGGIAHAVELDVRDDQSAREVTRRLVGEFGGLDILVNNAGVDRTAPFAELTMGDWDQIMAVNLRGPILLSKLAIEVMRPRGTGHIVNILSTAAKRAWANAAAYHTTKWGLLGFSHALHVEARTEGIKVTAVVAGGMRTPFLLDRFPDIDVSTLQDPRNVAETVRFVLSQPDETVIPEVLVVPMTETSWP